MWCNFASYNVQVFLDGTLCHWVIISWCSEGLYHHHCHCTENYCNISVMGQRVHPPGRTSQPTWGPRLPIWAIIRNIILIVSKLILFTVEAVRIFQGEKILSTPSFGREVKPWVPCRRFPACKRSLNWRGSRNLRQDYRLILAHIVPPFTTRISCVVVDVGEPGGERWNVQTGGGGG